MGFEIDKPSQTHYSIACNPIKDIYHIIETKTNQQTTTGQPILVSGLDKSDTYDVIFSYWEEDENGEIVNSTKRDFTWSVGYNLAEVNETIGEIQQVLPNIFLSPIKHPDRDEYALPWNSDVFSDAVDGPTKDVLLSKHVAKVSADLIKSKGQMQSDGWQ